MQRDHDTPTNPRIFLQEGCFEIVHTEIEGILELKLSPPKSIKSDPDKLPFGLFDPKTDDFAEYAERCATETRAVSLEDRIAATEADITTNSVTI